MMRTELAAALGASAALHAAAFAALEQLPRGWQAAAAPGDGSSAAALRVSLTPVPPSPPAQEGLQPPLAGPAAQKGERRKAPALPGAVPPYGYYPAHLLDERPQVRVHVEPAFPPGAPESGRVKLQLFIDADGRVEEIVVIESEPQGVFEYAAAQAFAPARFTPGRFRGEAVKSLMAIEVLFGLPTPLR